MKLRIRLTALFLLSLPALLPAQWAHYNDSGKPHTLLEAPDGGWVIASDTQILKLSPRGYAVWGQRFDHASCTKAWLTADGGVLAAAGPGSGQAAMLFKLSPTGAVVWQKAYGPEAVHLDVFCPAPDGGMVMAGNDGESGILVFRCSPDGTILWQRSYRGSNAETATAATVTSDDGVLVAGSITLPGTEAPSTDLRVLKLSSTGEIEWQKEIGGNGLDSGETVFQTADGGFLVAGHTSSFDADGLPMFWLLKLSPAGVIERELTLDYPSSGEGSFVMQPAPDGSYVAAFLSSGSGPAPLAAIATIGPDGAILRESYVTPDYSVLSGAAIAIAPTGDGGCLVSLTAYGAYMDENIDSRIIKLSAAGLSEWQKVYGSRYSPDEISLLSPAGDDGYLLAGATSSWGGLQNALWVLRTAPDGSVNPNCYFIRTGGDWPLADASTVKEAASPLTDAVLAPAEAAVVAQPAGIVFASWGPRWLPALGRSVCTLKINAPAEAGTTNPTAGPHVVAAGTQVHLSVTPASEYVVKGWNGNIVSSQSSLTIVVDGDKDVTADFHYVGDIYDDIKEMFGCFVATAAYGDPSHPDVEVLRKFRDRYLMKSRLGRDLVRLYYRYSPPVAAFVAKRPVLRAISRAALAPAVALSRLLLGFEPEPKDGVRSTFSAKPSKK